MKTDGFDFAYGFKCSDVGNFEKQKVLSIDILEVSFLGEGKEKEQKLRFIEINRVISDRVVDLLIYIKQYVLIKHVYVLLGDHVSKYVCR